MGPPSPQVLTGALGVVALPTLGPGPSALGAAVGRRRALPAPLLGAVGAGHRALAPRAPLLPLSVHWPWRAQKRWTQQSYHLSRAGPRGLCRGFGGGRVRPERGQPLAAGPAPKPLDSSQRPSTETAFTSNSLKAVFLFLQVENVSSPLVVR